jgi:hypothetical protein
MPNYFYYQKTFGNANWYPVPAVDRARLEDEDKPPLISVLAVSIVIDDDPESTSPTSREEMMKLAYGGPFYCDWDSEDELLVIEKVNKFLDQLEEMRVDLECCELYATGGRGYHLEVPQGVFMAKVPAKGVIWLPSIYREMATALAVDTLDLKIYSGKRGRMWRTPNVKRDNGRYKVPVTLDEMRRMTPELCRELTGAPRAKLLRNPPKYAADLAIEFDKAAKKVDDLLAKRKKYRPDPQAAKRAHCDSIQSMMAGLGVRPDAGFQELSLQLAVAANTANISEDQFIAECEGIVESHVSDSDRYSTPAKRRNELRRMHNYTHGNPCYEFSVGAIKSLLTHSAPDLDGITITKEDLLDEIKQADADVGTDMDEYRDVASGITLTRHGIWKSIDGTKRRICAVSFQNSVILVSMENLQTIGYETDILVNGNLIGRQMLEMEVMSGLMPFNRLCAKYGHAFQGQDADVRTTMMRFVEQAKKKGKIMYVVKREGLDVLSIPNHENPVFREPFLAWSDGNAVITEKRIKDAGLELTFQGFPNPQGVFKTDIAKAPALAEWIEEGNNREDFRLVLENLMTCQRADLMGKLIGWYTACFWKQIFQKVYGKFPLLHVNGAAGVGKTETNTLMCSLFNYRQEVRPMSPASSVFALQSHLTASSSIPLIIDEYKPTEMHREVHNKLKLMLRDAYNQRDITRGGGTRESDDYRSLSSTELSGPLVFIAEAAESEAAVMERVVLATFARPPAIQGLKNLAKFQMVRQNHEMLGILGQYIAAMIVRTVKLDTFRDEFDALYDVAKSAYLLTEKDLDGSLTQEELTNKQNAKERSVFNHTVAKFGFQQFRKLINEAIPGQLDATMASLEEGIYDRLADLNAATTPEHIKVLAEMAQMSHHVAADQPDEIKHGREYALVKHGERDCIEIAVVPAYAKYRVYCRNSGSSALFEGRQAFMLSVRDSPAFVKSGTGAILPFPDVYTFDMVELAKFGVNIFKTK